VATERFAEYVAQTLPGYPVGENQWAAPPFGEVTSHSFARVLDDSLLEPGFFGHNVILLSHALRHRQRLTEKEWMRLLAQTESATRLAASDADPDSHPETHAPSNHRLELNEVVEDHLRRRPGNVHRITLCDAVITLWDGASPLQKQRLLALLEAV
jgi:hypothetical protein